MSEEIYTALVVLGVGMITVSVILGLVVLTGALLIRIVNRFSPEVAIKNPLINPKNIVQSVLQTKNSTSSLAAIVAAVDIMTKGKGKADKIERIE
ncbi:MAG: oxaloacetate decarboxylase gamma subunit [Saprospiraceae bacterium]|jgi:oxaloacetate decarboxylase gamma subunit